MAAREAASKTKPKTIEQAIRSGDSYAAVYLATMKAARLLDVTESARDARPLYSCVMEGIERLDQMKAESQPKPESHSAAVLRMVQEEYDQRRAAAQERMKREAQG
jgi:hypothetical protein